MPHPGPKGRCSVNIPQLILSIVDVAAAIFLIAVVLLQSGTVSYTHLTLPTIA